MRPIGDVSQALLESAAKLATEIDGQRHGPTLQELAAHARVGSRAALNSIKNLTRAGKLQPVAERRVDYRNRPVAEYAPARKIDKDDTVDIAGVFAMWASQG